MAQIHSRAGSDHATRTDEVSQLAERDIDQRVRCGVRAYRDGGTEAKSRTPAIRRRFGGNGHAIGAGRPDPKAAPDHHSIGELLSCRMKGLGAVAGT